MAVNYLIDTNAIIDAQSRRLPEEGLGFLAAIMNIDFTISFVSFIEYMSFANLSQEAEEFIKLANLIHINQKIIDTTILLRKRYHIKMPDAIIAATTLEFDLILISHNLKDFSKIEGLKLIDPYHLPVNVQI